MSPAAQDLELTKAKANLGVCLCVRLCVCVSVSREDLKLAVQSGDWKEVREFYLTTFNSFIEINAAFKVKHTLLSSLSLTHSLISIPSSSYFFLNCVLRMLKRGACCCVSGVRASPRATDTPLFATGSPV